MARPIVVGLTGGIGTGKSNVLQTLVSLGAEGIDADRVAHEVMAPGGPAYDAVVAAFGSQIVAADRTIDRRRVAARVFSDAVALAQLEQIVHPAVVDAIRLQVNSSTAPLVAIEAIKLLEAGLGAQLCDQVWVTRCARRRQIARLVASRNMTEAEVRRRLVSQMPPDEMAAHADRVIGTDGSFAETAVQVLAAWRDLRLPFPVPRICAGSSDDADGIVTVLNSVVREGGLTVLDRTLTIAQERTFLRRLPSRCRVTLAEVGKVVGGFQIVEPYVQYTRTMDHVASLGSYVVAALRGHGVGRAMSDATFAYCRSAGFGKIVISIRNDNRGAQAFYARLGFQPCGRLVGQVLMDGHCEDQLLYELFL